MDGRQRFHRLKTEPLLQLLHIVDSDIAERLSKWRSHAHTVLVPNADGDAVAQCNLRLRLREIDELLLAGVATTRVKIADVVCNQIADRLQSFFFLLLHDFPPLHGHCHFIFCFHVFLFLLLQDIRLVFDRCFCE